jgi:hypothetical protein
MQSGVIIQPQKDTKHITSYDELCFLVDDCDAGCTVLGQSQKLLQCVQCTLPGGTAAVTTRHFALVTCAGWRPDYVIHTLLVFTSIA